MTLRAHAVYRSRRRAGRAAGPAGGGLRRFEGIYLIPPAEVDWGPWTEAADAILDLREGVDIP